MDNMVFTLVSLLKEAEDGGTRPSAIVMNKKSFEVFFLERSATGERIVNSYRFNGYPVIIDDSIPDYEIFLEGYQ